MLTEQESATNVHGEHPVSCLIGQSIDRPVLVKAGGIDQEVDPTEVLLRHGDRLAYLILVGNITCQRD